MKHTASIAATEAVAEGICRTFAPMVDGSRDARWGRVMEEATSRTNIQLPGAQQKLLKELVELGKPVGLIIINGRFWDLSWKKQVGMELTTPVVDMALRH